MAIGIPARGLAAQINVTPLIDILLVMLIIFMVVAPVTPKGLNVLVPQPPADNPRADERPLDIIVTVQSDGTFLLNQERVAPEMLRERLLRIHEVRGDAVIFVRASRDLEFHRVAHVIDTARGAGLSRVALMTN